MNIKRRARIFLGRGFLVAAMLLLGRTAALGQGSPDFVAPPVQLESAGIPSSAMNDCAARQQKTEWCWAASIQMALSCYHIHVAQPAIVARTYGVDANGEPINTTGSIEAVTQNLSGWGIDQSGQRYVVGCVAGEGLPNAAGLVAVLRTGHPVILNVDNGAGGGHAIVCTAVFFTPTENGPLIQSLVVRDPWDYGDWAQVRGRHVLPAATAVQRVRGYWVVTAVRPSGAEGGDAAQQQAQSSKNKLEDDDAADARRGYDAARSADEPRPPSDAVTEPRPVPQGDTPPDEPAADPDRPMLDPRPPSPPQDPDDSTARPNSDPRPDEPPNSDAQPRLPDDAAPETPPSADDSSPRPSEDPPDAEPRSVEPPVDPPPPPPDDPADGTLRF